MPGDEGKDLREVWAERLKPLEGLRIKRVRYMTDAEQRATGWYKAAVILELGDGTLLFPSREGNDAGALFIQQGRTTKDIPDAAPVI